MQQIRAAYEVLTEYLPNVLVVVVTSYFMDAQLSLEPNNVLELIKYGLDANIIRQSFTKLDGVFEPTLENCVYINNIRNRGLIVEPIRIDGDALVYEIKIYPGTIRYTNNSDELASLKYINMISDMGITQIGLSDLVITAIKNTHKQIIIFVYERLLPKYSRLFVLNLLSKIILVSAQYDRMIFIIITLIYYPKLRGVDITNGLLNMIQHNRQAILDFLLDLSEDAIISPHLCKLVDFTSVDAGTLNIMTKHRLLLYAK